MEKQSIPRRMVEIYSKPDCSLCSTALATLAARWRYDIPVVCIDGVVAFRGRVSEDEFERRLSEGAAAALGVSSRARGDGGSEPG